MKLEQKGTKKNILKYRQMQAWRAKRNKQVQSKLQEYGADKCIIDSSQVVAGLFIKKQIPRILKKVRARRQQREEAGARARAQAASTESNNTGVAALQGE